MNRPAPLGPPLSNPAESNQERMRDSAAQRAEARPLGELLAEAGAEAAANAPTSPAIEYGIQIAGKMIRDGKVERHLNANRIAALCALAFEAGADSRGDVAAALDGLLDWCECNDIATDLPIFNEARAALAKVRP
jgi:hypothetical protein